MEPVQLLLTCAGAASASRPLELEKFIGPGFNWDDFIGQASRHRVLPLVYRALRGDPQVPPHALETLKHHANGNTWNMLRLAKELVETVGLLRSEGIAVAAFKGPALALSAYGDLALRQSSDLDLLVKPSQIAEVVRVLSAQGYKYQRALRDRPESAERRVFYNHAFTHNEVTVEVHWSFSEDFFPFDFDQAGIWRRLARVTILEKPVATLGVEDSMLALCVHGARHCWDRLAWVADVAHLALKHHEVDYQHMLEEASARGVFRVLGVGLTLARDLLEAPIAESVVERLRSDPVVQELSAEFAARLTGSTEWPPVDRWLSYVRLRERLRDRITCCLRSGEIPQTAERGLLPAPVRWCLKVAIAVTPNSRDYSWARLPAGFGLYWIVRPIRLVLKILRPRNGR